MSNFIFNPLHSEELQLYPEAGEFDSRYLLLDQTTPQSILSGAPIFDGGLKTGIINAKDANGLSLFDDGGNGIFVADGGNVGIGTTSPSSKLDVRTTSDGEIARIRRVGATNNTGLFIHATEATSLLTLSASGTSGNQQMAFAVGGAEKVRITNAGNVGIGTTSPARPLHVVGTTPLRIERSGSYYFDFSIVSSGEAAGLNFASGGANSGYLFTTRNSSNVSVNALRINGDGNVGIGTTSPSSKLHIQTGSDSMSGIRVRANSSTQTSHLTRWEDSSGNARLYVDGDGRLRGSISGAAYLPNQLVGLQGIDSDCSMTGMYDRNELSNAALRGVVTAQIISGPGSITGGDDNRLFNSVEGYPYFTVSGGDSTTKMEIHIDLLENQSNYWSANWHPFVHFRTVTSYAYFKKVTVEVSPDNVTWHKPPGGEWETSDVASDVWVGGYWFGGNAIPNSPSSLPGGTYRYVRFIFEEVVVIGSNTVYISQIGLRHKSAPYLRQYALTSGTDFYGAVNLKAPGTTTDNISLNTNGNAYFNGNVGIGTTSPSTKLDIGAGAMTLEAMTAPSSPASDKAVLFLEATGTSPSRTVALKVKWQDGSTSTLASVTV